MKKGQVTIFIILGIVILLVFMFAFVLARLSTIIAEPGEFSNVENYISSCLALSSRDEILLLALKGGYYEPPKNETISSVDFTLLKDGDSNLCPDFKTIEEQLESTIETRFIDCIDNAEFKGIKLKYKKADINITVYPDILVYADFPVKVKSGRKRAEYDEFIYRENAKLANIISVVNKSITQMIRNENKLNLTLFDNSGMDINTYKYKDGILIDITSSEIGGEPLRFVYAAG